MNPLDKKLKDFWDVFLVECPSCDKSATVFLSKTGSTKGQAQLTCLACGHAAFHNLRTKRRYATPTIVVGGPVDPYFHLPLWLRGECCGQTLWAYNYSHLAYLATFVEAKHRDGGPSGNRNLSAILPKWMGLAKNRLRILRAIGKLAKR